MELARGEMTDINLANVGELYQDVWRSGLQAKGVRKCSERYRIIHDWLLQYCRPFSVLDIGACFGYFGARINEDFPRSVVAAVEADPGYLAVLGQVAEAYDGLFVVPRKMSLYDLDDWACSEHFDVVLALSVVHHFKGGLLENIRQLRTLGRHLIIEVPVAGEKACNQPVIEREHDAVMAYLDKHGEKLGEVESHTPGKAGSTETFMRPIYHVPGTWQKIRRSYLLSPKFRVRNITVDATFDHVRLTNHIEAEQRDLITGFNLFNLMALGWPDARLISIKEKEAEGHGDVRPWNMIVPRGRSVTLIDGRTNGLNEAANDALWRCVEGVNENWLDPDRYCLDWSEEEE